MQYIAARIDQMLIKRSSRKAQDLYVLIDRPTRGLGRSSQPSRPAADTVKNSRFLIYDGFATALKASG